MYRSGCSCADGDELHWLRSWVTVTFCGMWVQTGCSGYVPLAGLVGHSKRQGEGSVGCNKELKERALVDYMQAAAFWCGMQ